MIDFEYHGEFSQDLIVTRRNRLSQDLEDTGISRKKKTHILAIFVEMAQNIQKYSCESSRGSLFVSFEAQSSNSVTLRASNPINLASRAIVEEKIRSIAAIPAVDLQEAFRRQRREGRTERGGGLGLLEIARLSDVGLQWQILKMDERILVELSAAVKVEVP